MPKKDKKSISKKQAKYLKGIQDGLSKKESALRAGYTPSMADHAKEKIEKDMETPMARALRMVGATDEKVAQRLNDALFAKRTVFYTKKSIARKLDDETGKMKIIGSGAITSEKEVDDHQAAMKAVELVGKFKGQFLQKIEHSGGIDIDNPADNLSTADLKKMMDLYDKAKKHKK